MLDSNTINIIRFIEEEYAIDVYIASKVDIVSNTELLKLIEPKIVAMNNEIAKTLNIDINEAILLYNEYTDIMVKVSTMLVIKD